MKKALTFLLSCITVSSAYSQHKPLTLGITSGIELNSYWFVDDIGLVDFRGTVNPSIGIAVTKSLGKNFSISSQLIFTTRNFKEYYDFSKLAISGDPLITSGSETLVQSQGFIDVPLQLSYSYVQGEKMELFQSVGLVGSSQLYNNRQSSSFLYYERHGRVYNDFLVSAKVGFGVLFKFEKIALAIEPQSRIYLNRVHIHIKQNPFQLGLQVTLLKVRG